jgi:hypothetical protein
MRAELMRAVGLDPDLDIARVAAGAPPASAA